MKKVDRKELVSLLDLDFDKYEYYINYLAYRYSKKDKTTEYFGRENLSWEKTTIDIHKRFLTPFEFDVDMFDDSHKDAYIDWTLEYVNRGK